MMTREEELRRRAALFRQAINAPQEPAMQSPGFQNQSAGANEAAIMQYADRDYSSDDRRIAERMARARSMMGGRSPGAEQYGNIVAPANWGEIASDVTTKLLGGYELRQAREQQEELDANRALTAEAQGLRAARAAAEARAQQGIENDLAGRRVAATEEGVDVQRMSVEQRGTEAAADREARAAEAEADRAARAAETEAERQLRLELEQMRGQNAMTLAEQEARLEREAEEYARTGDSEALTGVGIDTSVARQIASMSTEGSRKAARTAVLSLKELNEAMQLSETALQAGADWTGGLKGAGVVVGEMLGGIAGESGRSEGRNQAKEALYDTTEKAVRGKITRAVEAFRRSETGANLTSIEQALGEDWNPAEARDEEEAIRRMRALAEYMNNSLTTYGLPPQSIYQPTLGGGSGAQGSSFDDLWNNG